MKRYLVASLALALSACAVGRNPASLPRAASGGVVVEADSVILDGEWALAAAELAYLTAADGVERLVDAGVIHGATATQLRDWNARARALLVHGKATADAAEKARDAAAILDIVDKLGALGGGR